MGLKNRKEEWDSWFATILYVCMYNLDASSELSCKKFSLIGWAVFGQREFVLKASLKMFVDKCNL